MTFGGKAKLILEWNKSCIELIALYVHPKNSNHLRSHLRAVMALHHSRLGLENKSGRIFCVRQVYFQKSCQQIWERVSQSFLLFIPHHIWGERVLWGAVFIIQILDKMQYFTIFQGKLHSFNIQDHRNTRPAGSHFWQVRKWHRTLIEVRFNIIKNLYCIYSLFNGFIRCLILKRVWYARHFEYSCKRCSWTTENKRRSD